MSDFFDYVSGKLSGKDRNAFERRLQKDPFEAEAAEGFAKVSRDEAEHDLAHVASRIRSRIRRKRRIVWYSAAAAVASLMIVATIFFTVDDGSMDRYKTAPEFEEAAQEQPSGAVMEREKTRKDEIPEAEDLAKKEVVPDEQELQEGMIQYEDQVMQEELVQDPEELAKKDVIPDEQELQKGLIQDEDPVLKKGLMQDEEQVMQEGLMQDEDQVMKEELMKEEDRVNKEDREQDMFNEKREAAAKDAADLNKRAVPVTPDEPVIREFQQDEVPELEEMQPAQVKSLEEEMPQQVKPAQVNALEVEMPQQVQAVTRTQTASETLQGQVQAVTRTQAASETLQGQEQAVTRAQAASETLQGEVHGVEVAQPARSETLTLQVKPHDPVIDSEYIAASPVDGIIQYNRYMDSTLVYPPAAGSGDKEVVVLKFSISPDGRPENFRVVRSPGESFTEEAIRVISNGPDWNPATRDGTYVDDDVRLRIVFRPE